MSKLRLQTGLTSFRSFARRFHWAAAIVGLLVVIALLWVTLRPDSWTTSLVFVGAAVAVAIIGRGTE